jgi:hypothetical protein
MSVKKPLVITNGQIEQLQSGDTIEHPGILNRTNNNASPIVIGEAVYVDGAGSVDLAQADAASTTDVLGLVSDSSIASAASGGIITSGVLAATTGEWDVVTGQVGGLTVGAKYWLDESTPGSLTATAPTTAGEFVAPVGKALSATEFEVDVDHTIKL